MLKITAIGIAILILGVLVFAAMKPDTFRVQRSASIKAPPEKIFPLVNDLQRWSAWSPWEKKDLAMKRTFGATTAGKGAVYEWDGEKDAQRKFDALADGGKVQMPIAKTFFSPAFGMVADRFGVSWMVIVQPGTAQ